MPLAMSNLSLCFMVGLTAILDIQFLKVCGAETPDLFAKHCETTDSNPSSRLLCRKAELDHPSPLLRGSPLHTIRELGRDVKLDYFCHGAILQVILVRQGVDRRQLEKLPMWAVQEMPHTP
jgi:hypothetical protein